MAAVFNLYKKGSSTIESGADVDNAMCQEFGVEPHPVRWYMGWMDYIGLMIACGTSLEEEGALEAKIKEAHGTSLRFYKYAKIVRFLRKNYVSEAYHSRIKS